MKLGDLMAARGQIDPNYTGILTNDDNVLAINISGDPDESIDDYAVVQGAIVGVDAQMNAITQDKQYIRAGQSTAKTGTQRTFKATGDRYIGDDFQDYVFDNKIKYGVGQSVVTEYVWFCLLNGKGEKGRVVIIDNSDGSGNAGETAAIDIDLKKTGDMPTEFNYVPAGTLGAITVTSVAGTASGDTRINASPSIPSNLSAKYKTDVSVTLPVLDETLALGWNNFINGSDYTANNGDEIAVVYADASNKCKYAGKTTVVAAP